jgi:formate C-acetyltransferase
MLKDDFLRLGEYAASGLYEEPDRSLFYRKSLGLRRFYENCELAVYRGESLYPSGVIAQKMDVVPKYLRGLTFLSKSLNEKAPILAEKLKEEFCVYHSTVPNEHTVAGNMFTHSMPNYERILKEGLLSYIPRIERISDTDMREGLLHVVRGIELYITRCVTYLKSVSADKMLIASLQRVPLYPAKTAYDAIVAWNFIMYLDNCDNLGCLGKGILPYYKGENLIPYLENLYDNLDKNNGYSMSLDSECPELTVQCLKAAHGKRRPMIELFVDESTPDTVWEEALSTVKSGGGQPAFYNAGVLLGGLKKRFPSIRNEDLIRFCGGGCTESMLAGFSNVGSLDAGIHLLLILDNVIKSSLSSATDFEDFYETYLTEIRSVVETVKKEINNSRKERAKYNPLPMRTLLIDDCIDKDLEYNSGGARYGWSIINFAGLINVIDALLAIRTLVFEKKKYTPEEIIMLLQSNDSSFLREVIGLRESFGKDIEDVNDFSHKISERIFSMTETGELVFGEGFLSASIQFMSQVGAGKHIGATPDGRSAGAPLCDSLAAIFGKDTDGPTALLNSITSLDLKRALGVPVVNLNITQNFNENVLKALILGYMKQGGIQLQITYASRAELLDAYEHPEHHGNLIVRVGGYSEYFNRLSDDLKRMVINRTIQNGARE